MTARIFVESSKSARSQTAPTAAFALRYNGPHHGASQMTDSFDPGKIERPHPSLLKYFAIISILTGPGFFAQFPLLFFKYETLKYRFEDDGMSMRWVLLFSNEINLASRRIQDTRSSRIIIQQWFGLPIRPVQTAEGSAIPHRSMEAIPEVQKLLVHLYPNWAAVKDVAERVITRRTKRS